MEQQEKYPWAALVFAVTTAVLLLVTGISPAIVIATLIVWAGTLWLARARAQPRERPHSDPAFNRARFEKLVENAGTPMIMIEKNRVANANRAARELLGNHLIGQDGRIAFRHPEAIALLNSEAGGKATVHGLVRPKDEWLLNLQHIEDDRAVIELINQTAQADMSRAQTDFVANASHELRTPIAAIIGYAETVEEEGDQLPPETRHRFTATILSEARRLQNLVHDLMSLSRVEAEKHDLPKQAVSIAGFLEISAREAAGAERADRLSFVISSQEPIAGDQRQIEQLIRNLVDNALKYSNADTPVTISLETIENDHVMLSVSDEGDGIAAEHIPHLTRRFYRTDPGRSRASGGTGLGLAIVKHIVERHRARLDISSEMGQGTTVSIRFPRLTDE